MSLTPEDDRLEEDRLGQRKWREWGPYLSERQWGTVREDYSQDGSAWDYFTHDAARSRAYRWGEDGIAGISDNQQLLCFSLGMWNGRDPILKERLFGLTGNEGNHGEDVKELYYYLDATPTHSYLKMLYKYPQGAFPYEWLLNENRARGRSSPEFELIDTGLFTEDRYFDVTIEYAKNTPDDILVRITVENRGLDVAEIQLLPQLWFRNTWTWEPGSARPRLEAVGAAQVCAKHDILGEYHLYAPGAAELLFCDNDTNNARVFGLPPVSGYFKDAFHEYVVQGRRDAVNPARFGTKAAALYYLKVPPKTAKSIQLRLVKGTGTQQPMTGFTECFDRVRAEADAFYNRLQLPEVDADTRMIQRQAWAGMIWSKQFYHIDMPRWLNGDPGLPPPPEQRKYGRNADWSHLTSSDIISMPDKWEYPWYAAWDLGFPHAPAGDDRRGICQAATAAVDQGVVHAPQRSTAGLRVGVW